MWGFLLLHAVLGSYRHTRGKNKWRNKPMKNGNLLLFAQIRTLRQVYFSSSCLNIYAALIPAHPNNTPQKKSKNNNNDDDNNNKC
jgi:hypothetical protein